ncbi:ATP-binding cassette domain-containing protein [Halomonas sp. NO4]|uniref:ATP-binding cassette domain-containing protein n=1 Tax=Halomonas sp. NO4 TaxID=2484813 RepID=UPI001F09AF84|nr:ATP-binding cassette domain-containing protein [Halomonas sp. NO4]
MPRTLPTVSAPALALEAAGVVHRGQTLLNPLTLTLDGCRRILVMGPNGAGKSLLLRLAHGLLSPSSGRVRWQGRPPRQAMVFQRPVLLRRSALDNLTYALAVNDIPWRSRKPLARQALARFGLAPLEKRPARVLSGGEQQRLALARAWLLEPEVLFLDEPTAALDPASMRAVEEAVCDFHALGTRVVMTTHDLHQARRLADEVVLLHEGSLVEHSTAERFFTAPASSTTRAFLAGELVW